MFLISFIDYHRLLDIAPWAYGIGLLSLVAVKLVGTKVMGGNAGSTSAAASTSSHPSGSNSSSSSPSPATSGASPAATSPGPTSAKPSLMVGVPMVLVLKQPDLGTALTYFPVLVAGLFLGGIRLKQVAILMLAIRRRRSAAPG